MIIKQGEQFKTHYICSIMNVILSILFCCCALVCSIPALMYSSKSNSYQKFGDTENAKIAAHKSRKLNIISTVFVVIGIIIFVLYFILLIIRYYTNMANLNTLINKVQL